MTRRRTENHSIVFIQHSLVSRAAEVEEKTSKKLIQICFVYIAEGRQTEQTQRKEEK